MSAAPETAVADGKTTTMGALKTAQVTDESKLPQVRVGFTSLQSFQLIWRVAGMFAASSIVPQRFQNNPANCAIALEMAERLGASPLMVMQNLYVVYGNPGWAAKFLIACFNQCGRFTSIRYAFEGTRGKDDWGCRAWAIEKATGDKIEGPLINIELAKKEGWYDHKDSKWKTIPEQMLRYRSGAWLINTVAPEISMGLRTTDELDDIYDAKPGAGGQWQVDLDELRNTNATDKEAAGAPAGSAAVAGQAEGQQAGGSDDNIPHFSATTAIDAIKNSTTARMLEDTWKAIREDFAATKRSIPVDVEATYNDRVETLRQKGEQLKF